MISKMNKLTALIYHKDYKEFLLKLRAAGVLHVELNNKGAVESKQLQQMFADYNRYSRLVKTLERYAPEQKDVAASACGVSEIANRVDEIFATSDKMRQTLMAVEKEISILEPWGDFDISLLDALKNEGYYINLYSTTLRAFDNAWCEKYNAVIIKQVSTRIYFVTVTSADVEVDVDAELVRIPSRSLSALKSEAERLQVELKLLEEQLASYANEKLPAIRAAIVELQHNMEFSRLELNGERLSDDKLVLLQGWVPQEEKDSLNDMLSKEPVYYEFSEPQPGDDVPIRFKNNAFFRLFEPICELYMLPKYNELDLTPFFAPFYMIFFGLCLGDMGYGLVISIAALAVILSGKLKGMRGYVNLALTLGLSTIACGSLTGSFFGFSVYDCGLPFVEWWRDNLSLAYVDPETGVQNDTNSTLFNLSFILGGIQIAFAMILKMVNQTIQLGFKYALSTVGWLILLLSAVVMFFMPSVNVTLLYILMGIGAVGIFLLNSPGKNIFMNIGLGLWDTYNMATGLLGDMLSYMRLFALGLSGGVLAMVFNQLATGMSPDVPVVGTIVTVLIFVVGHCINMFMNVLGAFVHPIRLTFVEFFKNAGYEGGGTAYRPFKK